MFFCFIYVFLFCCFDVMLFFSVCDVVCFFALFLLFILVFACFVVYLYCLFVKETIESIAWVDMTAIFLPIRPLHRWMVVAVERRVLFVKLWEKYFLTFFLNVFIFSRFYLVFNCFFQMKNRIKLCNLGWCAELGEK